MEFFERGFNSFIGSEMSYNQMFLGLVVSQEKKEFCFTFKADRFSNNPSINIDQYPPMLIDHYRVDTEEIEWRV